MSTSRQKFDGPDGAGTARVVWGASLSRGTASDPEAEPSVTARSGSMPWEKSCASVAVRTTRLVNSDG